MARSLSFLNSKIVGKRSFFGILCARWHPCLLYCRVLRHFLSRNLQAIRLVNGHAAAYFCVQACSISLKLVALHSHCVLNSFMYLKSTATASGDQANFIGFSGATGSLVGIAFLLAVF